MKAFFLPLVLVTVPPVLAFTANRWIVERALENPSIGLVEGALRPCPPEYDCVTSQGEASNAQGLPFEGDPSEAFGRLVRWLTTESGAVSVVVNGDYAYAVFARRYVKLIEHVEFQLSADENLIHLRVVQGTPTPAASSEARAAQIRQAWANVTLRERQSQP